MDPGTTFAGFQIEQFIGHGAAGNVYRARNMARDLDIALKVFHRLPGSSAEQAFVREAGMITKLKHPRIVEMRSFGIENRTPWIEYQLVRGGSLAGVMRGMNLVQCIGVLEDVASALDFANDQGIIHRDLKPENILIDENGRAFLADFGLAKLIEAATQSSVVRGTAAYMSPEQCQSQKLTRQSDIYSLGVLCYEWATGELPYQGAEPIAVMMKHVGAELPRKVFARMSPVLAAFFERALAKRREDRFGRARELVGAFGAATSIASLALPLPEGTEVDGIATAEIEVLEFAPTPAPSRPKEIAAPKRMQVRFIHVLVAASVMFLIVSGIVVYVGPRGSAQAGLNPPAKSVTTPPGGARLPRAAIQENKPPVPADETNTLSIGRNSVVVFPKLEEPKLSGPRRPIALDSTVIMDDEIGAHVDLNIARATLSDLSDDWANIYIEVTSIPIDDRVKIIRRDGAAVAVGDRLTNRELQGLAVLLYTDGCGGTALFKYRAWYQERSDDATMTIVGNPVTTKRQGCSSWRS